MMLRRTRTATLLTMAALLGAPSALAGPRRVCSHAQAERVKSRALPALFEVSGAHGRAIGFVYQDRHHILTAHSVVRAGRGFSVRTLSGKKVNASLVASASGLALLRLDQPASAAPLEIDTRRLQPQPVLAFSSGRSGRPKLTQSFLDAKSQLRRRDRRPLSFGPVLDCSGTVIGVRGYALSRALIPIQSARALLRASKRPYRSGWRAGPLLSVMTQIDRDERWFGPSLGLGLIDDDRLFVPLRIGVLALSPPRNALIRARGLRLQGELGLGYRWLLWGGTIPVYMVPTFTIVGAYDWRRDVLEFGVIEQARNKLRVAPAFGLSLNLSLIELSYQLQLDLGDPERPVHQIGVGAQFL